MNPTFRRLRPVGDGRELAELVPFGRALAFETGVSSWTGARPPGRTLAFDRPGDFPAGDRLPASIRFFTADDEAPPPSVA